MLDILLLVADKNMKYALQGVMSRPRAIGIREFSIDIRVHTLRDAGVRVSGVQALSLMKSMATHSLMVLDFEGSGASGSALELETQLRMELQKQSNWGKQGDVVVIEPELDIWIWGADNRLCELLEWREKGSIRDWLQRKGFGFLESGKPVRPKEAFECVLRQCNQPRSSDLYGEIAKKMGLKRCRDLSFQRLKGILLQWFSVE